MTSKELLKADVLDILFENRNKSYGAYTLRKFYANRLMMALSFTIASVVALLLLVTNNKNAAPVFRDDPGEVTLTAIPVHIPDNVPDLPQPAVQKQAVAQVAQVDYNRIVITRNAPEDAVLPTQIDIEGAAIGNSNISGVPGDVAQPAIENGNGNATEKPVPEEKEFITSQAAPEFPGGVQAWMNFLSRNLHTPEDLEAGEKKTVLVRFMVSDDGAITKFEVMQSGGNAFDSEVIRVLKKMPKWKPAQQNGHAVAVFFTQPVTFIGQEE